MQDMLFPDHLNSRGNQRRAQQLSVLFPSLVVVAASSECAGDAGGFVSDALQRGGPSLPVRFCWLVGRVSRMLCRPSI